MPFITGSAELMPCKLVWNTYYINKKFHKFSVFNNHHQPFYIQCWIKAFLDFFYIFLFNASCYQFTFPKQFFPPSHLLFFPISLLCTWIPLFCKSYNPIIVSRSLIFLPIIELIYMRVYLFVSLYAFPSIRRNNIENAKKYKLLFENLCQRKLVT